MKNINYIINGILIVAVIVLFILQLTGKKADIKTFDTAGFNTDSTGFHIPIAYIKTDSLLANYKFYDDLNEEMMSKWEDKKLIINQRRERLANEVVKFQEKAQYNAFISAEKQQQEYERLMKQQQELDNFAAQAQEESSREQAIRFQQLIDTIQANVELYNTPKKYELILSNVGTDNIYYADDSYDITKEIIKFLNDRYVPPKK